METMRPPGLAVAFACALALAFGCSDGGTGSLNSGSSSSGSASGSGSGGGSSGGGDATQACVDTINQYRSSIGLPPYGRWTSGETCVNGQAQADSQSGTAHSAFGQCGEFAQNECPGWPGPPASMIPQCLQMMWGEGPGGGHYDNMTSTQYSQVACGFYTTADGSVWATQDFK
jgi:hypothetical protein